MHKVVMGTWKFFSLVEGNQNYNLPTSQVEMDTLGLVSIQNGLLTWVAMLSCDMEHDDIDTDIDHALQPGHGF